MTAYESLNRVRNGRYAYERLLSRVEYLTALSERATPVLSPTPKGSAKLGQTDEPWAALADYRQECKEKLAQYISDCRELEAELECIKSVRVRTAMHFRYVDLFSVSAIAGYMAMNERNVYKLLKRGRQIYEKHFEEGTLCERRSIL